PSLPITLPMSSGATRSSTVTPPSSSTSSTSTASGSSTSASAMVAIRSLSAISALSGGSLGGVLEQTRHRERHLSAHALPVGDTRQVERQALGGVGIERADLLDEATVTAAAVIGNDHSVEGALCGTVPGEADMNCHVLNVL